MPLYEYECQQDATTLTLLRTMSQADDPVEDPEGRGRIYARVHSTFQTSQSSATSGTAATTPPGVGCGCGRGGCGC